MEIAGKLTEKVASHKISKNSRAAWELLNRIDGSATLLLLFKLGTLFFPSHVRYLYYIYLNIHNFPCPAMLEIDWYNSRTIRMVLQQFHLRCSFVIADSNLNLKENNFKFEQI